MAITYCLGDFAKRIARLPLSQWKAEVEAMPETCDRCNTNCRQVCAEYARVQWRMAHNRRAA